MTLTRILSDRHFQSPPDARVCRLFFEERTEGALDALSTTMLLLTLTEAEAYTLGQTYDIDPQLAV
jgi:hypothetical protein